MNTGLKGRFQWLRQCPAVVADTAHNEPGIRALLATIESIPHQSLRLVLGFVRDKDLLLVLRLLPVRASYYFCQADSPRALPVNELVDQANAIGLCGVGYVDVNRAVSAAIAQAAPDDLILITGSTYVVAEIDSL